MCSGIVKHLTDQQLTQHFPHLVVRFYKLELSRREWLRGQVVGQNLVVVVDCDELTCLPSIFIFNQLFLVPLFPTKQDIGRDKMQGGTQPLSYWKSIKYHSSYRAPNFYFVVPKRSQQTIMIAVFWRLNIKYSDLWF